MTDAEFLQEVKRYVLEVDPNAEVWLFGSRARGDFHSESDWDFLMLTDRPVDRLFKYNVWDHLNELELNAERVISTRIRNRADWRSLAVTDFYQNVVEEGRML